MGIPRNALDENILQLEVISSHKRFSWHIDRLPVKIGTDELIDAGGDYDLGEVDMLYGFSRILLGSMDLLRSQDYTIAARPLVDYVLDVEGNPLRNFQMAPARALTNLYAVLLATSPSFLTLDIAVGAEIRKKSREEFSRGFDGLFQAVEFMARRKGDQHNHPFALSDRIFIPFEGEIGESATALRDDIAGVSSRNTNLRRDLMPWLAMLNTLLVDSSVWAAFVESTLSQSTPTMQTVAHQVLDPAVDMTQAWIDAFVREDRINVEMDLGAMFENSGNLREVMPAWTQPLLPAGTPATDPAYLDSFRDATLVYSYECADPLANPLGQVASVCDKSAANDRGHFHRADGSPVIVGDPLAQSATASTTLFWANDVSTNNLGPKWNANAPINPDGIAAVTPYIGFKDPTFGGVLFLNIDGIRSAELADEPKGMRPANLRTLNAALAGFWSGDTTKK